MGQLIYPNDNSEGKWIDVEQPGYLGKNKQDRVTQWMAEYGYGKWRLAWRFNAVNLTFLGACQIYEDSYRELPYGFWVKLTQIASEVYDHAEEDIESGTDYEIQAGKVTHIQDIAIRRCLVRLGLWFEGNKLVRVRGSHSNDPIGPMFSPGQIPFHLPILLPTEEQIIKGWWQTGSVEEWYQSSRWLQRRIN